MMNTKILVCTHRKAPLLNDDVYIPIQVGRAEVDFDLGYQNDNEGINIGDKHYHYGEFTGIYWAWKNMKNVDYIGWCHYRRYFLINSLALRDLVKIDLKKINVAKSNYYIEKLLNKYDVILPKKKTLVKSYWSLYSSMENEKNLILLSEVLEKKYPEYLSTFNKLIKNTNRIELLCMFITSWKVFDKYAEWLFSILEELELFTSNPNNPLSRERSLAFLGEILMPLFFHHNKFKLKHQTIGWVNSEMKQISLLRYYASNTKSNLRYLFNI